MKTTAHNLPVTIDQVIAWVRQCSTLEKRALLSELLSDSELLMLASEESLAKDWLSPEEEEVWKNL